MFYATLENQSFPHATGKIICVGRNYAEHAKELNNPVPTAPILFIKPADAAVALAPAFSVPADKGSVHHELEIAVLIGKTLKNASKADVAEAIAGAGLGLDLTLRDVQAKLKEKGHPWEVAKGFDGACPLTDFISAGKISDWQNIELSMTRNGNVQQQGNSKDMLFPVIPLIAHMSTIFTLNPGDIVMTGTPPGVGPLQPGDELTLSLAGDSLTATTRVE